MAFRIGEKCVYVGVNGSKDTNCIEPIVDSIQVIGGIYNGNIKAYSLVGFEKSKAGNPQWFQPPALRKLDYEFVEEVIKNVTPKKVEA